MDITLNEWCIDKGIDTDDLSKKAQNMLNHKVVTEISSTRMGWEEYLNILRTQAPFKTRHTYWFIVLDNDWAIGVNENPAIGITYPMVKYKRVKETSNMTTLERLELDAMTVIEKTRRGEPLTSDESKILSIHNSRFSKTAGNAGKRKIIKTGRK